MEANAEYFNVQLLYCCEDHFDPVADLKNYFKYKLMNQEPILKPTAVLKNVAAFPQEQEIPTTSQDSPELLKMLSMVQPGPSSRKIRKLDNVMPSTSSATTLPIKVHVATQCKVKMVDSSTNLRPRKRKGPQGATSFEVHSSQEFSSATTPSLFGYTSETEETTSEKPKPKMQMRNNVLEIIFKKPKMYLGLPLQY
ncbi:uncharacterized protein LOC111364326, partial [Spodoptera litura]